MLGARICTARQQRVLEESIEFSPTGINALYGYMTKNQKNWLSADIFIKFSFFQDFSNIFWFQEIPLTKNLSVLKAWKNNEY